MARWINVTKPFEFNIRGKGGKGAILSTIVFTEAHAGDHFVKDDVADFAIAQKAATEGKKDKASRSKKTGPKQRTSRSRAKPSTEKSAGQPTRSQTGATKPSAADNTKIDATAANLQPDQRVGGESAADDGSADAGRDVAETASE